MSGLRINSRQQLYGIKSTIEQSRIPDIQTEGNMSPHFAPEMLYFPMLHPLAGYGGTGP